MDFMFPKTFMEFVGGISFITAILFMVLSIKKGLRQYLHKISGLLLLIALSAYAENEWCYLAVVFIIGTTVTELDFLQNIAAIIRGSEAYFKYKKVFVPSEDLESAINEEYQAVIESGDKIDNKMSTDKIDFPLERSSLTNSQLYVIVEELAFRTLERKFGQTISRHVSYPEIGGHIMQFDGVIETKSKDILIEILVPPLSLLSDKYFRQKSTFFLHAHNYAHLVKKDVELVVYIVVDDIKDSVFDRIKKAAIEMSNNMKLNIDFNIEILTYQQIGLK
jgi:hypothetical protein